MAKRGPKAADGKHVFEKVDEFGEVATAVEQRERGGEVVKEIFLDSFEEERILAADELILELCQSYPMSDQYLDLLKHSLETKRELFGSCDSRTSVTLVALGQII